jgi:hypothetical protein
MTVFQWILAILGGLFVVGLIVSIIWPEWAQAIGEGFCECVGVVCEGDWGGSSDGGSCGSCGSSD